MKRVLFSVVVVTLLGWAIVSAFPAAEAQALNSPGEASTAPAQWMTANGFAFSPTGLTMDGGVSATDVHAAYAELGGVDAGVVRAEALEVSGSTSFRQRPAGVFVLASLTKAASLTVGIGCSTLGTVSVAGMEPNVNACVVASLPSAALNLGVTYDCYVTASGLVTVRACGLVALVAAPAGVYRLVLLGPAS